MSYSIYSGGRIAKTRTIHYRATYNKLRMEYDLNPDTVLYFFPPPFTSICKNGARYNCFVEPKPVNNPSVNPPTTFRLSNIINNGQCYSKIQYANASAVRPFYVNYLGRTPGQPGGSGSPPKNVLQ